MPCGSTSPFVDTANVGQLDAGTVRDVAEKVLFGLRVRLAPTVVQRRQLAGAAGGSRVAYNHALTTLIEHHRQWTQQRDAQVPKAERVKVPTAADLMAGWVRERDTVAPWHAEHAAKVYALAAKDARVAYGNFLAGRARFPRFKSRRSTLKFRVYMAVALKPGYVQLPRIGDVKVSSPSGRQAQVRRLVRRGRARIMNVTVSQDATGDWWASLLIERTTTWTPPAPAASPDGPVRRPWVVGADVGIRNLLVAASTDGGLVLAAPRRARQERLLRKVRKLARRQARQDREHAKSTGATKVRASPSKGRATTRRSLARAHRKLAWARSAQTHQCTADLRRRLETTSAKLDRPVVLVLEDLNVKGMMRAGGAYKTGLNRALADASLGELLRQLAYKLGPDRVLRAPRFFASTKRCSTCTAHNPDLTLADRTWSCHACGTRHDRDLNAALNLAAWGEQQLLQTQAGDRPYSGPSAPEPPAQEHARAGGHPFANTHPGSTRSLTRPAPGLVCSAGTRQPPHAVAAQDLEVPGQGTATPPYQR